MTTTLDTKQWAQQQFADCQLGDKRRTRRLVKVAEQVANNPAGSLPEQMQAWDDTKAAYRLFDQEGVTFEAITSPHWQQTRQQTCGDFLILDDTTELNFGKDRQATGLEPTGKGSGRGFLLHNGLMVEARSKAVVGLAGQEIHYRKATSKKQHSAQKLKRQRESEVWGRLIDRIGPAPDGVQLTHVGDRAADNFEVFCHLQANRCEWVIRMRSLHRKVLVDNGEQSISSCLKQLPLTGEYLLQVRSRDRQPARAARLEVRVGAIRMPVPRQRSPYLRQLSPQPINMQLVWVREIDGPRGATPINWVLCTSLAVTSFADAWRIIEYYEARWLVEEYHKALKSGCRVTARSLRTAARLEALTGLLSVVAVRLLQLKSLARAEPQRPADEVIPPLWLAMLRVARRQRCPAKLTLGEFYRELAKLGGFLGRRHDGEPGWITIWRGWEKLNTLIHGAELAKQLKTCG